MQTLWQDLSYGLRILRARPGYTMAAVLTLALGVGANTAIFSAINALLLRPLPVEKAEQLVFGFSLREGFDPFGTSPLEYTAYRDQAHSFARSGLGIQRSFNLIGRDGPEPLHGAAVTADYMDTLGVKPLLGRSFMTEEDQPGGPAVALIGYNLWQRRFGGDSELVGQSLNLQDRSYTIIGILPQGFDMPFAAEIWVPLQINLYALPLNERSANGYEMIARLKPGLTIEQADAELKEIARQLEQEYPQIRRGWSYEVIALRRQLIGDLDGRIQKALLTLVAAVGFLLLICCANVANLLLARGVAREREIAIRLALGAGRLRLFRQLLTESLLLSLIGGLFGLLTAFWITPVLGTLSPIQAASLSTFLGDFHIDARVLTFSLLISVLTGVVFGSIPALKAVASGDLTTTLKQGGQRSGGGSFGRRWLDSLVVVEIAVAMVLLVCGGLAVKSFQRLQRIELGFRPDNLLTMNIPLSEARYHEHHQRVAFVEQTLERVKALPGVISAGMTTNIPLQLISVDTAFTVEGRLPANPSDVPIAAFRAVSPDYLKTIGVRVVRGRLLNEQDRADSLPVAVISEEMARQAWPGEDPIGKQIRRGRPHQTNFPWLSVVGVVSDIKEDRFNFRIDRPVWYLPFAQQDINLPLNLVLRAGNDPLSLSAAVREAIRSVDPEQSTSDINTMSAHLDGIFITEHFSAVLMATLASLGLLLASLGLYGVMSYSVSHRTGEIGLRMALGARPGDILRMVIGYGAVLIMMGLSIGLLGALVLTHLMSGMLFEVRPTDPATFVFVAIVLASVALLACYLPARRAARIDPMAALRQE